MNMQLRKQAGIIMAMLLLIICIASPIVLAQSHETADTSDILHNISFRNLGPAVAGGRVTAVVGIPGKPNVYYVGTAGGGIFKTEDGGVTWKAVFEKQPTASIGAVALAPSNTNLVWVGTGEANLRNDIITGKGVYFSPNGGQFWQYKGLKEVGQISRIVIDPVDPNIVFVAAIGHAWRPNPERGVYRTTDGGKTWEKVLFVNDTTGASDLIMQPGNPKILFAAMWQVVRHPWKLDDGGYGSGIYRSTDGGATWSKLTEGLPSGPLGRIALAIAPTNPNHVYALIESKEGMLWDSKDLGDHWTLVSNNHALNVRPFYFSRFVVAPNNEDKLYFLSLILSESTDGGKTIKNISEGMHVDHHDIWIDPQNPDRIIDGNDGGAYISLDGGKTWRYMNNIPIEQFYQVATDTCIPYHIGGGLQDNNAWYGPSANLFGKSVLGSTWFVVGGGDGEYVVPAPSDPNIVYVESQNGWLTRLDLKTGISRRIRPYELDAGDMSPAELKYRFNWTTPIAVSYTNPNVVYVGSNVVFKTIDGGLHWSVISPDLTRNDKSKQITSGGEIQYDISGAETYNTILSIAISPLDSNVIWVGTDDGLVHVTRDGGKHWSNLGKNIRNLPEWGRIYQIEASPFSAATAYITVDLHELDNNRPYVFKTDDFGESWVSISSGLPEDDPAIVVRENPNQRGFLVVGTTTGLFYSRDYGKHWQPLKSNFPTACVYDLKFVKRTHDLVIATHGRGIFIFDNLSPLEQTDKTTEGKNFHLFRPLSAYMFHLWNRQGLQSPSEYSAPNPPLGVMIDYYLKNELKVTKEEEEKHLTPVLIEIFDSSDSLVATLYGPSKKGFNRFVWNMRYQSPTKLLIGSEKSKKESPYTTNGPFVIPGKYKISVTVRGDTQTEMVEIKPDPRLPFDSTGFVATTRAGLKVRDQVSALNEILNRIQDIEDQISTIKKAIKTDEAGMKQGKYTSVIDEMNLLQKKLTALKDTLFNTKVQHDAAEDEIHHLSRFHDRLTRLLFSLMSPYSGEPTEVTLGTMKELSEQLQVYLKQFNNILKMDIPAFNKIAQENNVPIILGGPIVEVPRMK
ncbi:MAG: hypothetical protein ACP5JH_08310 [Bacteroidota bacterium]